MNRPRCMGCMQYLDWDGRCTHCGFQVETYHQYNHCLPLGTQLKQGEYTVGKVLGQGGFGITYIGLDNNLLTPVAIKEYFPRTLAGRNSNTSQDYTVQPYSDDVLSEYDKGKESFLQEAQTLAQFTNINAIVHVRSFFQDNGTAYIVMEYVEGISIQHYVQEYGKIRADIVLTMAEQIIQSLHEIHKKQLLHRDVSSDNLIIRPDGCVTILDFGAARSSNLYDQKTITTICKQGYSALEQYSKDGLLGPWTDVYGICATIYHMLTAQTPVPATQRALQDTLPSLVSMEQLDLSREIKEGIMKGLSVDPKLRYQTMEELYHALYAKPIEQRTDTQNLEPSDLDLYEQILQPDSVLYHTKISQAHSQALIKGMLQKTYLSNSHIMRDLDQAAKNRKMKQKKFYMLGSLGGVVLLVLIMIPVWSMIRQKQPFGSTDYEPSTSAVPTDQQYKTMSNPSVESTAPSVQSTPVLIHTITVPKVIGYRKKAAVKKLKVSGFRVSIKYTKTHRHKNGIVLKQSVPGGSKKKEKTKIQLTIAKYVEKKTTPATPLPTSESRDSSSDTNQSSQKQTGAADGDIDSLLE